MHAPSRDSHAKEERRPVYGPKRYILAGIESNLCSLYCCLSSLAILDLRYVTVHSDCLKRKKKRHRKLGLYCFDVC